MLVRLEALSHQPTKLKSRVLVYAVRVPYGLPLERTLLAYMSYLRPSFLTASTSQTSSLFDTQTLQSPYMINNIPIITSFEADQSELEK